MDFHGIRVAAAMALIALLSLQPRVARAAESEDSCEYFVDTLPATLGAQGTWCLRAHLATAIASGNAITVASNNVVLDCNHFTLDGTAAGAGTQAIGIYALNRSGLLVRNCGVRAFYRGVLAVGTNVEVIGNRITNSRFHGIFVAGTDMLVEDNRVIGTGGNTGNGSAIGIYANGTVDTTGNMVTATRATPGSQGNAGGIYYGSATGSIRGNRILDVAGDGSGVTNGIKVENSARVLISRNHVVSAGAAGNGLQCLGSDVATSSARENVVIAFAAGLDGCPDDASSNVWLP